VAEEVVKVDPHLVAYEDNGQPLTVRYDSVNAMLLNEVQKQARQIQALTARLTQLQTIVGTLRHAPALELSAKR